MTGRFGISERQFRRLVQEALDDLPDVWQPYLEGVIVLVEDKPSDEDLDLSGIPREEGYDLLGLYVGVPLTERGALDDGLPDRIMIYREAILSVSASRADVVREVQETVLHELGHHFGLGEDELPF